MMLSQRRRVELLLLHTEVAVRVSLQLHHVLHVADDGRKLNMRHVLTRRSDMERPFLALDGYDRPIAALSDGERQ